MLVLLSSMLLLFLSSVFCTCLYEVCYSHTSADPPLLLSDITICEEYLVAGKIRQNNRSTASLKA